MLYAQLSNLYNKVVITLRGFRDRKNNSNTFISKGVIYSTPSPQAGWHTRSTFKRSSAGLNSEFSFSWVSSQTRSKQLLQLDNFIVAGERRDGIMPFMKHVIYKQPRFGFQIMSPILYFTKKTVTSSRYYAKSKIFEDVEDIERNRMLQLQRERKEDFKRLFDKLKT